MPSTTICEPGDVVIVDFIFTNQIESKRRPAIVVSSDAYHRSRSDVLILAVTSQTRRNYFGDCELLDWRQANLYRPSVAKGTIHSIERRLVRRRIGTLSENDYAKVKGSLRDILGL